MLKLPENGRDKNRQGELSVKMQDGTTKEFGGVAEGEPLGRFYGYKKDFIIRTPSRLPMPVMTPHPKVGTGPRNRNWVSEKRLLETMSGKT